MSLKFNSFVAFLGFAAMPTQAALLVNPQLPYSQTGSSSTSSVDIYYAGYSGNTTGTLTSGATVNTITGYRSINTATDKIYLDISSTHAAAGTNKVLAITVTGQSTSNEITIRGVSEASGTGEPTDCGGIGCGVEGKSPIYTPGQVLRISFLVSDACAAGAADLCLAATGTTHSDPVYVHLGEVDSTYTTANTVTSASGVESKTVNVNITDIPPAMSASCPAADVIYFPGDEQISFFPSLFGVSAGGGVPVQSLLVMMNDGTTPIGADGGTAWGSNQIITNANFSSSQTDITGLTNTTNATHSDHIYRMTVQAQNIAGVISLSANACPTGAYYEVQSQSISGILTKSKCFIATAAYQDGDAAPVRMLRKFRDQVLSQFSFGQKFIKTYYQYSPALAEWAWDKPIIRSIALRLLTPIELMAWVILKFSEAEAAQTKASEIQPYIDRLKKELPAETDSSGESYTEQEKKKLTPELSSGEDKQPYINRIKNRLAEEEPNLSPSKNYSATEKQKLLPYTERESVITAVKEGRDKELGFGEMNPITDAAGIKLGVTPGMEVITNASHSFSDVYGKKWQPELMFHYERQLFHSENFGSFGLGTDFGMAYSGGNGQLQFGFNGSTESRTGFSFYQIPVLLMANYRFNLMRVIRPYVSAGPGSIFYIETRNDKKADKRGYSFVYTMNTGVSFLLDFLDGATHRDSFLSNGIQHTYFFVEYAYLNTFNTDVVFKRSGLYSGFLFEF